jgi:SAM-dependent methyltransferase
LDDGVLLWHARTGRHARIRGALRPTHRPLLQRLHMVDPAPLQRLIPVRSRWSVLLPERPALWHALPLQPGTGGYPFRALELDARGLAFLRACNGARPLGDLDPPPGLVRALCARSVQALQLRDAPVRPQDPGPWTLVGPPRPSHLRTPDQRGPDGRTTLGAYHHDIDPVGHFDRRETTLAHAFARPHPALQGRPYGRALRGALEPIDGPVLEVGAGSGELARDFVGHDALDYTRLDRSPGLLALQQRTAPSTRGLQGDALDLPVADASVSLLLSNEVLADLEAAPHAGDWPITPEPGQRWFNTGAFGLLREAWRVLRPGGRLWISEFGALDERPQETAHLDHPEVSVHFGQLLQVARALGFDAQVRPVGDALGFDATARWVSRPSWEAARALCPSLQARAWTAAELDVGERVEGLVDAPIHREGPAPVLTRVLVLEARKPASVQGRVPPSAQEPQQREEPQHD